MKVNSSGRWQAPAAVLPPERWQQGRGPEGPEDNMYITELLSWIRRNYLVVFPVSVILNALASKKGIKEDVYLVKDGLHSH